MRLVRITYLYRLIEFSPASCLPHGLACSLKLHLLLITSLLPLRARSQASQLPQVMQPTAMVWITHLHRLIQAFAGKLAQISAARRDL
jgi:hypothetical protein